MPYFKNYSFEYNAQKVDLFKATAVCSTAEEADLFKEGVPINIEPASFYGVIVNSKDTGARMTIDITAESWGRELRNTIVASYQEFRQVDAIKLIEDYLLPTGWELTYPSTLVASPRFISYILRNGTYASHIGTVMDALGLDYTIYSAYESGELKKRINAYYRDNFDDRVTFTAVERVNIGNLNIMVDYGKIATSIVVLGSESEQGVNQVWMDAEMGDWTAVPHIVEIRDTQLKIPEFPADSAYFGYFPASETDYTIEQLTAGSEVFIGDEHLLISQVYFLSGINVASLENGDITYTDLHPYLLPISSYTASGMIVASVYTTISPTDANAYLQHVIGLSNAVTASYAGRNLHAYGDESVIHAIYDEVLISNAKVSLSKYLTFGKNLPATNGFIWFGSERAFYRSAADNTTYYTLSGLVRGLPTCAVASCEHCGTREALQPVGWYSGCPYGGFDSDECISKYCTLAAQIKTAYGVAAATNIQQCPLVFETTSVCPVMACPFVKNETDFRVLCVKGLAQNEISWTNKYVHHKDTIVFPDSYYYSDSGVDIYEIYARDSLIEKYGYLPTQISVKGIADLDGLDKVAEGRLRLSAIPAIGTLTMFHHDPWITPASVYPGCVIDLSVASRGRYNGNGYWYPTYWFDTASESPEDSINWQQVDVASWVKTRQKFTIQKTVKSQRACPEISFGAGDMGFQSVMDYVNETLDSVSQRHRNQDPSVIVNTSDNGLAAKVQNIKTGEQVWIRMVR